MNDQMLRIPKKLQPVTLWVHPEGRVVGSIYLYLQSNLHAGEERPQEVLNHGDPFLVLKDSDSDDFRFYNKHAIVRVQYQEESSRDFSESVQLSCGLHMNDGSLIEGTIKEFLPPAHSRLYDYINGKEPFLKLHAENGEISLVNKAYIVQITPGGER